MEMDFDIFFYKPGGAQEFYLVQKLNVKAYLALISAFIHSRCHSLLGFLRRGNSEITSEVC